jgi:hypothetical protein
MFIDVKFEQIFEPWKVVIPFAPKHTNLETKSKFEKPP